MIGIGISFDLGRYHATPWGAHVNEGLVEWPPSPWRILRAMYAISRTNAAILDDRDAIERALAQLASASPPRFVLPPMVLAHTRHYVPSRLYSPTKTGETDRVLDAFAAVDPRAEIQVWWDASLAGREQAAFGRAVASLGYLGRSESICSARLLDSDGPDEPDARPASDDDADAADAELVPLLCFTGQEPLATMTVSITDLRRKGMLQPPGTHFVDYLVRRRPVEEHRRSALSRRGVPTLGVFRLQGGARPSFYDAVSVCNLLRSALQRGYDADGGGIRSAVFSGHSHRGPREDQHRHAHFLALPDTDGRRVGRLVVWAPEGFGDREVEAMAGLRSLYMREAPEPLRVVLTALGAAEDIRLPEIMGPSDRWRSLTPFALPRHPKLRGGVLVEGPAAQIRRELGYRDAGKSALLAEVVPRESGRCLAFRRTRPGVSRLRAPAVVDVELRFAEGVRGPIVLGALSHFGFGLFAAVD